MVINTVLTKEDLLSAVCLEKNNYHSKQYVNKKGNVYKHSVKRRTIIRSSVLTKEQLL